VTGKELLLGGVYGAAFGDALLAAYAIGDYKSIEELEMRVKFRGSIKPNLNNTKLYQKKIEQYIQLYEQTKELMHQN
jgi:sugar (pentulose or hexulose) kinase